MIGLSPKRLLELSARLALHGGWSLFLTQHVVPVWMKSAHESGRDHPRAIDGLGYRPFARLGSNALDDYAPDNGEPSAFINVPTLRAAMVCQLTDRHFIARQLQRQAAVEIELTRP